MKPIATQELKRAIDDVGDVTLINTLPADKFDDTRIKGAINIPQDSPDFVERVMAAVSHNPDAKVVVYCGGPNCHSSTQAAEKLDHAGFTNVFDYDGGAEEWNRAGQSAARR